MALPFKSTIDFVQNGAFLNLVFDSCNFTANSDTGWQSATSGFGV